MTTDEFANKDDLIAGSLCMVLPCAVCRICRSNVDPLLPLLFSRAVLRAKVEAHHLWRPFLGEDSDDFFTDTVTLMRQVRRCLEKKNKGGGDSGSWLCLLPFTLASPLLRFPDLECDAQPLRVV